MLKWPRIDTARLLEGWTRSIVRHPLLVVILSSLVVVASLFYTISHFRINTDLADMISDQLPYRKLEKDLQRAFPQLGSTIVVVIDAEIPEAASHVRDRMLEGLKKEASRFKRIYVPGGGEFFEKNGLLYMSLKELEDLSDSLASAQPLLGFLSQDLSLRGLFSVLEKIVAQEVDAEGKKSLIPFFDRLSEAFEAAASGRPFQLSWQELIVGKDAAKAMSRQFIILEPLLDENSFSGGGPAIEAIRRIRNDLALDQAGSAKVRLTGDVALEYENLVAVRGSMGVTTLISFILVALALAVGLGSGRLVFASLLTLLVGLIWTLGFAIVFIGHLNLISVAFGVLFIGLGIDYGIQFCLRYRESIESGLDHHPAIVSTVKAIGVSLRLSTVGAAIGFYSFLPTAYTGVLELGLIAGTGMFINLFATLVLLPALLTLMPLKKDKTQEVCLR